MLFWIYYFITTTKLLAKHDHDQITSYVRTLVLKGGLPSFRKLTTLAAMPCATTSRSTHCPMIGPREVNDVDFCLHPIGPRPDSGYKLNDDISR